MVSLGAAVPGRQFTHPTYLEDLERMSAKELQALWNTLMANDLPFGAYFGATLPLHDWLPWRGKIFAGFDVVNMFGTVKQPSMFNLFHGDVFYEVGTGTVLIKYVAGLHDRLRQVNSTLWLGQLFILGRHTLWFTLHR